MSDKKSKLRKRARRSLDTVSGYVRGRIDDTRTLSEAGFDIGERVLKEGKYEPATMLADALALSLLGWSTLLNGFRLPARAPQEEHGGGDDDDDDDGPHKKGGQ